ncbi:DUF1330 domain-containing protein [Sandarakinorhabdus oryzae]|uniref:DUF1330 domain-containing protein n=1 Tax=Sandarakinorhabdus oryzae TaxID=2675220 RepID=UPI0012E10C73|nr:DUF1330 domain-containing protein [Sandarakinorhabdus oryzae]
MAIPTHGNHDASIDPTRDQVRALRDHGRDGPVVMMNLLKFRKVAEYPSEMAMAPCSGEAAYALYQHAFTIAVGAVSQAEVLYDGPCEQVFIGQPGTEATDWDKLLLVRYPTRQHFLNMMADTSYRDALVHRYAGLERTVLIQCAG